VGSMSNGNVVDVLENRKEREHVYIVNSGKKSIKPKY